jgi:hypothetical protein
MMRFAALALLFAVLAQATELNLKAKIAQSLEAALEVEAHGIENCENKCEKSFNRFAYQIALNGGSQQTYEFQACVMGCSQCATELEQGGSGEMDSCFNYCKNYPWKENGIVKGVIEPDKACMGGCIINTCQVVCKGGTTASKMTKENQQFFYPNGGCSIKTQPYSQNLQYVPWDSPNTGQGGSEDVAQCCANALSLCQYVGNTDSTNYRELLAVTQRFCKSFVGSDSPQAICQFFSNPQNCGTA